MRRIRRVVQTLAHVAEPVDPRVDLIELRLDLHPGVDVAAFAARCGKPVVASARRARDGGRWDGPEPARRELLRDARGAAFVDVELDVAAELAALPAPRLVSFHDCAGMPEDLDGIFERCLLAGAALVKIAVTPPDAAAAFRLLDLPTCGLGMGAWGGFTRVLAPLTYCASTELAPGMPTPGELLDLYDVHRLSAAPALLGVAGDPVAHSRSPALHNRALRRDGIDAVYLPFRVRDLAAFWPQFRAHGGIGLSVTAPLKLQAAALACAPDDDVRRCGSANTLLADGRACNTDYRALLELLPRGPGRALVLGAGGAARAAVAALRDLGHTVSVWARRPDRAAALGAPVQASPSGADLVVNTTPLDPPAAPFVVDLRYGPEVRPPACGVDGLTFLRAQARHQYRLFTGREL